MFNRPSKILQWMVGFLITLKGGANGLASMTWESEISSGALPQRAVSSSCSRRLPRANRLRIGSHGLSLVETFVNAWFLLDKRVTRRVSALPDSLHRAWELYAPVRW